MSETKYGKAKAYNKAFWDALRKKIRAMLEEMTIPQLGILLGTNPDAYRKFAHGHAKSLTEVSLSVLRQKGVLTAEIEYLGTVEIKPLDNWQGELKKVGTIFDSEKSTHYIFDTRVHLIRENSKVICLKDRDRTGILPDRWEYSHEPIKKIIEQIAPKSKPENFCAPAESKLENGNSKHPPNYIPSPKEDGWELFPIPDSYLYKEIRGKGISWDALAKDNGTICMDTKLNHPVKARYLLHKMLGFKEKPEIIALAKAILELYPSEEDKCKLPQMPPAMVTAGITPNPDAEPAPEATQAQTQQS